MAGEGAVRRGRKSQPSVSKILEMEKLGEFGEEAGSRSQKRERTLMLDGTWNAGSNHF